ncbi:MAG: efflux RND transporter periplasmic adaptor subunit [Acidobacteriota bacterium]
MKRALIAVGIVTALGAGAYIYVLRHSASPIAVNTTPVTRGDVIDAVASTGTLQAVTTVQVGSQVSGNIQELRADFNSIVRKGQVVARLDPALFQAQLDQAKANLAQARANQTKARSDLDRMKVQLLDAQQKYTRAKELAARNLLPASDLDAAKIAVDSADASLQSQQATLAQTAAAILSADATVHQNQVNLDHTIITAPIDGIVTQRSVDVGQTVAASMQAPTIFIIAADLTKMQVNANIDESDVGRIRPGQRATFRVDAYPTEQFGGVVTQIRLQPVVQSNVTTYGTIINVPNADLKLKPGMTANLRIEVAHKTDILRVPNAALRFRPTTDMFAALNQPVPPEALTGGGRAGRGQQGQGGAAATTAPSAATPAVPRDPAQRIERFKAMSPEQQQEFLARLKRRGADTSAFESATAPPAPPGGPPKAARGAAAAQTIDALFAPLPVTETRGRVWLFQDKQLKAAAVRLGITDGTNTELIGEPFPQGTEVVTSVTGVGTVRPQAGGAASSNPLLGNQRGGGPGGFGGGGGGRGR